MDEDAVRFWELSVRTPIVPVNEFASALTAYLTRHGYTAPSEFGVVLLTKYCISEGGETVSRAEFDFFVRLFQPFSSALARAYNCLFDATTHTLHPWFHGYQSREVSSKLLSDAPLGAYVLRYSIRNVGCIVLSFAAEDGSARVIRNCLVYNHGTHGFGLNEKFSPADRFYTTIQEIIGASSTRLLRPVPSPLHTRCAADVTNNRAHLAAPISATVLPTTGAYGEFVAPSPSLYGVFDGGRTSGGGVTASNAYGVFTGTSAAATGNVYGAFGGAPPAPAGLYGAFSPAPAPSSAYGMFSAAPASAGVYGAFQGASNPSAATVLPSSSTEPGTSLPSLPGSGSSGPSVYGVFTGPRTILLYGHERAVTCVKYNHEGDLLFTSSMDGKLFLWRADNGDRIGSYQDGESNSSISELDITRDSRFLLTGSGDYVVRLWKVDDGTLVTSKILDMPCRGVAWAEGEKQFLVVLPTSVRIMNTEDFSTVATITYPDARMTRAVWMAGNERIAVAFEDGHVRVYDVEEGGWTFSEQAHTKRVTSLNMNRQKSLLLTTSVDGSANLYFAPEMKFVRTFKSDTDVNAGAISPIKRHVVLGGGPPAVDIAKQDAGPGKLDSKFYNAVTGEEFGRISGHFGPIQTMAIHPDGRSFVTGAFDGFVRLNHFDPSYFKEEVVEDADLQKMLDGMTEEELYELQHEDDPDFQRSEDESDDDDYYDEEEEEEEEAEE